MIARVQPVAQADEAKKEEEHVKKKHEEADKQKRKDQEVLCVFGAIDSMALKNDHLIFVGSLMDKYRYFASQNPELSFQRLS